MIQTFRRTGQFSDRVLRLLNQTQQSAQRHFKALRRNKEGKQMVKLLEVLICQEQGVRHQ